MRPCSFRTNLTKVTFDKASHYGDVCYQGSSLLTFRRLESAPALIFFFFLRQSLVSNPELESPVDFSLPLCENQLRSCPPHTLAGNSPVGGSRRASQPNPIWQALQEGPDHQPWETHPLLPHAWTQSSKDPLVQITGFELVSQFCLGSI